MQYILRGFAHKDDPNFVPTMKGLCDLHLRAFRESTTKRKDVLDVSKSRADTKQSDRKSLKEYRDQVIKSLVVPCVFKEAFPSQIREQSLLELAAKSKRFVTQRLAEIRFNEFQNGKEPEHLGQIQKAIELEAKRESEERGGKPFVIDSGQYGLLSMYVDGRLDFSEMLARARYLRGLPQEPIEPSDTTDAILGKLFRAASQPVRPVDVSDGPTDEEKEFMAQICDQVLCLAEPVKASQVVKYAELCAVLHETLRVIFASFEVIPFAEHLLQNEEPLRDHVDYVKTSRADPKKFLSVDPFGNYLFKSTGAFKTRASKNPRKKSEGGPGNGDDGAGVLAGIDGAPMDGPTEKDGLFEKTGRGCRNPKPNRWLQDAGHIVGTGCMTANAEDRPLDSSGSQSECESMPDSEGNDESSTHRRRVRTGRGA